METSTSKKGVLRSFYYRPSAIEQLASLSVAPFSPSTPEKEVYSDGGRERRASKQMLKQASF